MSKWWDVASDQTLAADEPDLDPDAFPIRHNGGVAAFGKVDVRDGLMRFDQHLAQGKVHRLQMGLEGGKVLLRHRGEKLIANG